MSIPRLPGDLERVVFALYEDVGTPFSLRLLELAREGKWSEVVRAKANPCSYSDPGTYYADCVAAEFLRKCAGVPTDIDRKAAAVESFWAAERGCYTANERLSRYLFPPFGDEGDPSIREFLVDVKKLITSVLGPVPQLPQGRFGPGATFLDRGRLTTLPDKMTSSPTLTPQALGFLFQWSSTAWARALAVRGVTPTFVRGNRFTTVPKDSTKDRGIAIEPSINLFYQLGYGRVIRERLRNNPRISIDLDHHQDVHRALARKASIDGTLATIDLSSASDLICRNLVKLLLPANWFEVLDSLRSPTTQIEGRTVHLEKFSSMGNGFTFELETLIFLAIAAVAVQKSGGTVTFGSTVSTFGDDIIVPSAQAGCVVAALRFCGLEVNASKTFMTGSFRESCGGDFFDGVDVRAFNLKEIPREPHEWIALANGLYRLGRPDFNGQFTYPGVRRAWLRALEPLPSDIRRCRGPQVLGDIVIHDTDQKSVIKVRNSIRYYRVWKPARYRIVKWNHFHGDVQLATRLYLAGSGTGRLIDRPGAPDRDVEGVIPRDSVSGYNFGWVPYS